nr:uncharacterized protein LOC131273129 [Dasypus novemcinctus]
MLHQLFRDLLTNSEPDSSQWENFREKLDQGGKLAESLYHELQSENREAAAGEEELPLDAGKQRQLKSLSESSRGALCHHGCGPYRGSRAPSLRQSVASVQVTRHLPLPRSCPSLRHHGVPWSQEGGSLPWRVALASACSGLSLKPPVRTWWFCAVSSSGFQVSLVNSTRFYRPEEEAETVKEVLEDSVEERYLAPSSLPDLPGSLGPGRSGGFLFDDYKLDLALDEARMKTSPKLECDSLENPAANNHGCQVIGHTDATSAFKEKILKRKLLLSKRKLSCRFPGLHAQTEILRSAGKMLLI